MPRLTRTFIAGLVLLAGVAAPAASAAVLTGAGPLLWTAPGAIDSSAIDGVACPATNLCVAVDRAGRVLWSTNPAGGARRWQAARVDGGTELSGISCPSTGLCVAVDAAGDVLTSQNPTGGPSAWTVAKVDLSPTQANSDTAGPVLLRGVSCPSTGLCVAVDGVGNALVSTDPTGGPAAWTITHADTNRSHGCSGAGLACQPPLVGVACPTTALCAAVDFSGNILTTRSPALPAPWSSVPTAGNQLSSLWGVSCPVAGFCATVNGTAGRVITFDPGAPAAQRQRLLPYGVYRIWCQSPSLCLASAHTRAGVSGLLGSYNPGAPAAAWSLSSLGGVTALACPSAALCVAGDGEGEIAAGLTTRAIASLLRAELLRTRHLPTIAALDRTRQQRFVLTSPIAARVTLVWTVPGPRGGAPVTVAAGSHGFTTPGTAPLTVRLTPAGVRLFRAATKRVTVTATATFAASTGSLRAASTRTFAHPPKPKRRRHR